MAITRLPDVFPAHRRRVIWAAVALQLILLIVLGTLLSLVGLDWISTVVYGLLPVAVLQTFAFIVIGKYALEPLDFLARTITHFSDQPHVTTPPNLNGTYHERTGFKLMVDTIYSLAARTDTTPQKSHDSLNLSVFDKLPVGIVVLDEHRSMIYTNERAPLGSDTNGSKHIQLDFDNSDTLESWLNSVETSQLSAHRTWQRIQNKPAGQADRRVFDITVSYHKNGAGGADTLIVFYDQTTRYALGEESMDFMALAAHELRGPITIIRGYLDVLKMELDNSITDDQRQIFDRLEVSSSRLSTYIGNILNAAKFDRRHLQLHLREDSLLSVYALVADDLALRASTQGRFLTVTIPEDLPTIAADRSSLTEVIANFVDNGIKYSREGGHVTVTAQLDGDFVRCSVEDHGIGIPGPVISRLSTKFYRSHRSKSAVSGTGLGLYISKAVIESHGGHVGVTSTEGEGSTFTFSLPVYATVADKLLESGEQNNGIIETSSGWIKNHSMYRG